MRRLACRRGMTLVEVIVVISMIGILVSLLLPAFQQARLRAKSSICLSNLHQLDLALAAYAQDHAGDFPTALDSFHYFMLSNDHSGTPVASGDLVDIQDALKPYVSDRRIFRCPMDRTEPWVDKPTFFDLDGSSYEYHEHTSVTPYPSTASDPTTDLLFCDYGYFHGGDSGLDGRLNGVFADGHAQTITWQQKALWMPGY